MAAVVLIAMMSDRREPRAPPVASPQAESLELLSLQAARDGSTRGHRRVRSRAEEPLTAVTAVVSAIDARAAGRTGHSPARGHPAAG